MAISSAEYGRTQLFFLPRGYVTAMSNYSPSAEEELFQKAWKAFLVLYGTEFLSYKKIVEIFLSSFKKVYYSTQCYEERDGDLNLLNTEGEEDSLWP